VSGEPGPVPAERGTGRARRWPRRVGALAALVAFALLVLAVNSAVFNALTQRRAGRPGGLTYLQTSDVRTRVRTWGTTGRPVVLVPGAFETADTFEALGEQLAVDHRVYALDLTGTGYSDPVPPYTVDHFAEQVDGLLDAEGLTAADAPLLVGHSSGAAVVGLAALRSAGRVAGVMFLDGDARPFPFPSLARSLVAEPFRTSVLRLGLGSDRLIRAVYDTQCGPLCPELDAAEVERWRRPLQQPGSEAALWQVMERGIPTLTDDQTDELRDSPVVTSVAGGVDDPQFERATADDVARRIGAPPPTFLPGRHLPMLSAPAELAGAIRALERRAAAASSPTG
jgi:pimeloyl-ACP methyl ester carboxylesterase